MRTPKHIVEQLRLAGHGHLHQREKLGRPLPRHPTLCERLVVVVVDSEDRDNRVSNSTVFGWPSQGGVIVLREAGRAVRLLPPFVQKHLVIWSMQANISAMQDLSFLNLPETIGASPQQQQQHTPQILRDTDQFAEDIFCQSLLRLGAKWFDSHARYAFVEDLLFEGDYRAIKAVQSGAQTPPSAMERKRISVAVDVDGFWVAEYELHLPVGIAVLDSGNLFQDVQASPSRLSLAKTMSEKCEILKTHAWCQVLPVIAGL